MRNKRVWFSGLFLLLLLFPCVTSASRVTVDADGGAHYLSLDDALSAINSGFIDPDTVLFTGDDQDTYSWTTDMTRTDAGTIVFRGEQIVPDRFTIVNKAGSRCWEFFKNNNISFHNLILPAGTSSDGDYGWTNAQSSGKTLSFINCVIRDQTDSYYFLKMEGDASNTVNLVNCLFEGNAKVFTFDYWNDPSPTISIINCTFDNNTQLFDFSANGLPNTTTNISLKNCIFSNNTTTFPSGDGATLKSQTAYSLTSEPTSGYGAECVSNSNPQYLQSPRDHPGDWMIAMGSPAENISDNSGAYSTDISSKARDGTYDAGCWEVHMFQYTWDTAATAGIQPGTGTWGADEFWTVTGGGGTSLAGWPGIGGDATFSGVDAEAFRYYIAVYNTQNVNSLTFLNDGFAIGEGTALDFRFNSEVYVASGKTAHITTSVTGTGGLDKRGSGILYLSGACTYGTTTVSEGALSIGNGGTGGSVNGDIIVNDTLYFNRSDDIVFSGDISGGGKLVKFGAGKCTFTGNVAPADSTLCSDGSLQIGNGGTAGSIDGPISINGELIIDRSDSYTMDDAIGGSGSLIQNGTGTLILSSADFTFTGTTTVNDGTLQIGIGGTSVEFASDIVNNSVLVFNRADAMTYDGGISGSGTVTKEGSGTLVLTGSHSYDGATTVSEGTLQIGEGGTSGSLDAGSAVTNNAAIVFDRSDSCTYDGTIGGSGSVTQAGSGSLTINGDHTYTGATTVSDGTLILTGSLASAGGVTVESGAVLAGTGSCGAVTVTGGTVSPGVSGAGKLSTGDLSLNSSATLDFVLGTWSDTVAVDGDLTLDGTIDFTTAAGFSSRTYRLFTVTGTIDDNTLSAGSAPSNATFTIVVGTHDVSVEVIPSIIGTEPSDVAVTAGEDTSFSVTASGVGTLSYEWFKEPSASVGNTATLSLSDVSVADSGRYRCIVTDDNLSDTSEWATLTVLVPARITVQPPADTSVLVGSDIVRLEVTADGSAPLVYKWYKDLSTDSLVDSGGAGSFELTEISFADSGSYYCIVSNAYGTETSEPVRLHVHRSVPSGADIEPDGREVTVGDEVRFTISVPDMGPFTYEWYRVLPDDDSLLSAAGDTLFFSSAAFDDEGGYYCIVTNSQGSDTSDTVQLTVHEAPPSGSDMEPDTLNSAAGESAHFTVTVAGGTEPFSYEWYKITADSDSALENDEATFTIASVARNDSGGYFCVVTNPGGSDTSDTAFLFVGEPAPVALFTLGPKSGKAPLEVLFTDESVNRISSRLWRFGDESTSTEENPSHVYTGEGLYTVTLMVYGPGGVDSLVKTDSVFVYAEDQNPVRISARYLYSTEVEITITDVHSIDTGRYDSLGVWSRPEELPSDASEGTLMVTYAGSVFSKTVIVDTLTFPDGADSVFGIMTGLYRDGMSLSEFLPANGCIVLLRDTTSPSNNLEISANPLDDDSVRVTISSIGSVDTAETDSFSIWYGEDTTDISMTGPHTLWYAFSDLTGDDEESFVIDDSVFTGLPRTMYVAVTLKGVNGRFSPPVIAAFTTINLLPGNPLKLEAEAETSTRIRLTWNSLDDTSYTGIRVWYGTGSIDTGLVTPAPEYETVTLPPSRSSLLITDLEVTTRYFFGIQVEKNGFWSVITDSSRAECTTLDPDDDPDSLNTILIDSLYFDSSDGVLRISWCIENSQLKDDVAAGIAYSLKQYPESSDDIGFIGITSRCTDTVIPLGEPLRFDTLYYIALWFRNQNGKLLDPTDYSRGTVRTGPAYRQAVTFFDTSSVNDTVSVFNGTVILWKDSTFTGRPPVRDTLEIVSMGGVPEGMIVLGRPFLFRQADSTLPFFIGMHVDSLPDGCDIEDVRIYDVGEGTPAVLRETAFDPERSVVYVKTANLRQTFVAMIDMQVPEIGVESDTASFVLGDETLVDSVTVADNIMNITWKYYYSRGDKVPLLRGSGIIDLSGSLLLAIPDSLQVISSDYGFRACLVIEDGVHYDTVNLSRVVLREESDIMITESNVWMPLHATADLKDKKAETLISRLSPDDSAFYDQQQMRLYRWITYSGNVRENDKWVEFDPLDKAVLPLFTFDPGRLFWLKTRGDRSLHLDSAYTLSLKDTFTVTLPSGQWTDFGMPFRFRVPLADILAASDGEADSVLFYVWNRDSSTDIFMCEPHFVPGMPDRHDPEETLDYIAKGGYSIYNRGLKQVLLRIPPILPGMSPVQPLARRKKTGEWCVKVFTSTVDGSRLSPVYCGYAPGITKSAYPAAPSFSDVRIVVADRESGQRYGHHIGEDAKDGFFRELLFCNNRTRAQTVCYDLGTTGSFPERYQAFLFNPRTGQLDSSGNVVLKPESGESRWLITGDASYRQQVLRTVLRLKYALHTIYPNPARSMVTIRYTVPLGAQERLRILVFNILGRRIWEERIDGFLKEGTHLIIWNGHDINQRVVGSGTYIVRLQVFNEKGKPQKQFDRVMTYLR